MISTALFLAGSYLGFRLGARYSTITIMSAALRTKVMAWLHMGDTK